MLTRCQDCFTEFPSAGSSQTANKASRWETTKLPWPAVYSPANTRASTIQPKRSLAPADQTKQEDELPELWTIFIFCYPSCDTDWKLRWITSNIQMLSNAMSRLHLFEHWYRTYGSAIVSHLGWNEGGGIEEAVEIWLQNKMHFRISQKKEKKNRRQPRQKQIINNWTAYRLCRVLSTYVYNGINILIHTNRQVEQCLELCIPKSCAVWCNKKNNVLLGLCQGGVMVTEANCSCLQAPEAGSFCPVKVLLSNKCKPSDQNL